MSYTWEEAEAWAKRKRAIDDWRKEVAYSSQPIIIPTRDRAFRNGAPAPVEVSVDDGMSFKSGPRSVSVRESRTREEPRIVRRRTLARRPSSDNGGYSRSRRSGARSPSRTIVERATPRRRSSSHHHRVEVVREEPAPAKRSGRVAAKPAPPSFLNSFFPPTNRGGRSRAATYEKSPSHERIVYERPRHRDLSPRYRARALEPEDGRARVRAKSVYSPQQAVVVSRKRSTMRSGSVDINDRMRLLAVRDRFRDELDRAREFRTARPEPQRYREYDRRSTR
ncbi:hypothetical protein FKW77_000682 [Venturia effusa]|uniref:Uncharacterized protein n=1 Tax=Venturia effusa TaxID=50376 RepID=A0A517LQI6_9PEZI|nr:hypothetical protein FKW77_000682 [Venturia effusa]